MNSDEYYQSVENYFKESSARERQFEQNYGLDTCSCCGRKLKNEDKYNAICNKCYLKNWSDFDEEEGEEFNGYGFD